MFDFLFLELIFAFKIDTFFGKIEIFFIFLSKLLIKKLSNINYFNSKLILTKLILFKINFIKIVPAQ